MANGKNQAQEFLNPKSMITPGAAGGIVMVIANTLWFQFGLEPRWSGLVVSLLLGLVVFAGPALPIWQRGVYYLVNSLIIFCVAAGASNFANSEGNDVAALQPWGGSYAAHDASETPLARYGLIATARAQTESEVKSLCADVAEGDPRLKLVCEYIRKQPQAPENAIAQERAVQAARQQTKATEQRRFFKPWFGLAQ